MKTPIRVAVTGAAGQIGYSLLFRIASGSMFGPDQPVILHLIEIEPALPALGGVVMELQDCAFPLLKGVMPTSSLDEGFKGVDWAASPILACVGGGVLAGFLGVALRRPAERLLGGVSRDRLIELTDLDQEMLQVRLDDAVQTDQIFTILMGDQVEPRRQFIEDNALNVKNLDI